MALDPSTLCARTADGEAELATASQGLSLGQRRVLALLQDPVAVDELAQRHHLEPEKLARDLTRLAELRLIVLQGPAVIDPPPAPTAPRPAQVAVSMAPVVIGPGTRRFPMVPLAAGAAAFALAVGIWYGTRSGESTPTSVGAKIATLPAPASEQKPTTLPAPAPTVLAAETAPAATQPSPITRGTRNVPPPDVRPAPSQVLTPAAMPQKPTAAPVMNDQVKAIRSDSVVASAAKPLPVAVPVAEPPAATVAAPPLASASSVATPPAVAVVASPPGASPTVAAPPPVAANPPPAPPPARDREAPVQLAAAAPSTAAARPAAPAGLKAISREPPDFPKEAIADGLRGGQVNARIHVDAHGNVTAVDILASQPSKVFDRAARRALLRWQFEPNAAGQSSEADVEVKFQRD